MSSPCSFRITRTAEDMAQAITTLSQRLVSLEERQESLELQHGELSTKLNKEEASPEEVAILDSVDQLLSECHQLLDSSQNRDVSLGVLSNESAGLAA